MIVTSVKVQSTLDAAIKRLTVTTDQAIGINAAGGTEYFTDTFRWNTNVGVKEILDEIQERYEAFTTRSDAEEALEVSIMQGLEVLGDKE